MPSSCNLRNPSASSSVFSNLASFCHQKGKAYNPSIAASSSSLNSRSPLHSTSVRSVESASQEELVDVSETPESLMLGSAPTSPKVMNSRDGSISPTAGYRRKVIKLSRPVISNNSSLNSSLSSETASELSQKAAMDDYEVFCEKEQSLRQFIKHNPSADIMEAQDILVSADWSLDVALEMAKGISFGNKKRGRPPHTSEASSVSKGVVFKNGEKASSTQEIVLDSDEDESFTLVAAAKKKYNHTSNPTAAKKRRRIVCVDDSEDDSCEAQAVHSTSQSQSSDFSVLDYQPPSSQLLLHQVRNSEDSCSTVTYSKLTPRQVKKNNRDSTIFSDDTSQALVVQQGKKVKRNQPKLKAVKKKHQRCESDDDDDGCDDYGNDDVYDSDDSNGGEVLTPARSHVLSFFQDAPADELITIPGCSKKKADIIVKYRPFSGWADMVEKFSTDKYLSGELLNGAKKVLDMRSTVNRLMNRCQRISLEMGDLVEALKENKGEYKDYISKQPELLNANMRLSSYQMLGLNWLLLMHNQEVNGILADEMGLGKTVQAISFLAYLYEHNSPGPHLIVVPSSTLDNWQNEMRTWWPTASVICYHGSQDSRRELRMQIINDEVEDFDIMVTTYNMVSSSAEDRNFFKRLEFNYVVFDEAHMLKNMASQRYQHLMKVKASRRLLLTGTPLQNNLVELMSLLIFAMPNMFSGKTEQIKLMFSSVCKSDEGKSKFERDRIEHAKQIMKPFVLRRLKSEVLKDLPKKHEEIRFCKMTESQHQLYADLVTKLSEEVQKKEESDITTSGSGMMMQLRKLANHPLLLRNIYDDGKLLKMSKLMIKEPTHSEANPDLIFEDMCVMSDFELHKLCQQYKVLKSYILEDKHILNSGKFEVFDDLLPGILEKGSRVLIFSQFTMVLDIVESYMEIRKLEYLRLDGQVPVTERQQLIDEFNDNMNISIFLLSTRAGGLGINLTSADTVLIHDIDFNPYNDKQAEDRCHRVGQQKDVTVIRMISEDTIEEGMLERAKEKLELERDVTTANDDEEKDCASVAKLLRDALGISHSRSYS